MWFRFRSTQEGYVKFNGHKTWYRIVEKYKSKNKYPLICLHGGPGFPHEYLKPLEAIANTDRQIIFYDQLGCGNSDHPNNNSLWTIATFKDELSTLLKKLKIEKYHLLGQSWGGILALEHALDQPKGLQSLILASTSASIPQWASEGKRLKSELPQDVQNILDIHETNHTTYSPQYMEAVMEFYCRHICRQNPWPQDFQQACAKASRSVYQTMWGINEFTISGNLKDWDVRDRLSEIKRPTLITSGRYDESTPMMNKTLQEGITHSKWVLFEKSAHLAHLEESESYLKVLSDFLNATEQSLMT